MATHVCATAHSLYPKLVFTAGFMLSNPVLPARQSTVQIALPKRELSRRSLQCGIKKFWPRLSPEIRNTAEVSKIPPFYNAVLPPSQSPCLDPSGQLKEDDVGHSSRQSNSPLDISHAFTLPKNGVVTTSKVVVPTLGEEIEHGSTFSPDQSTAPGNNGVCGADLPSVPACSNATVSPRVLTGVSPSKHNRTSEIEYLNTLHHTTADEIEAELSVSRLQRQNYTLVEGQEHSIYSTLTQMRTKNADSRFGFASCYGWKEREFIQRTFRDTFVLNRREISRDLQKMNTVCGALQSGKSRTKRPSIGSCTNSGLSSTHVKSFGDSVQPSKTLEQADTKLCNNDTDSVPCPPLHRACFYKQKNAAETSLPRDAVPHSVTKGLSRSTVDVTPLEEANSQPCKKRRPPATSKYH
jgi:hypothetical protein